MFTSIVTTLSRQMEASLS